VIYIATVPEPHTFAQDCRDPGVAWLASVTPANEARPKDLWSPFRLDLQAGFGFLCGYYAMQLSEGQVDHFISWDGCKCTNPELAYEWSNYRFISGSLNSTKGTLDDKLLDPFEIKEGWFEIDIPSLILSTTDVLPPSLLDKATFTLDKLGLAQDRKALALRWWWYELHRNKDLSLTGLRKVAPLLACAVEKWIDQGKGDLPAIPNPINEAVR
jgi:hypothetical protein